MTYSLGEVEALCRKAARGAGFSWGMAEEAGKTVRWLSSWGLPGPTALVGYLQDRKDVYGPTDPRSQEWSSPGRLCPLLCGTALSDFDIAETERKLLNVAWPLLLFPYWMDRAGLIFANTVIRWDGTLHLKGDPLAPHADVVVVTSRSYSQTVPCRPATRAYLSEKDLTVLNGLAALTYAPETEASKLSGAGAGLKDED